MTRYRVNRSRTINAPPSKVYGVLADYRTHHPKIVPPEYFLKLEVIEGGIGAGTRTRLTMRVLGVTKEFEHVISEPEHGRVLIESDIDGSSATRFTVDRGNSDTTTHLTIATELETRPGLTGFIERVMTSIILRRIYRKELALIETYLARP